MSGFVTIHKTCKWDFSSLLSSDPKESSDDDYKTVEEHLNAMLIKASEEVRFYF